MRASSPAMVVVVVGLMTSVSVIGCRRDSDGTHGTDGAHGHDAAHGHAHAENVEVFTRWTETTELFVEFPALVVGQESPFAAHLTRLADFAPVTTGRLIVTLSGAGGPEESFAVAAPTVPGIFRPVARPQRAGSRILSVRLESDELTDEHVLGMVSVYDDADGAAHAAQPAADDGEEITFLKEQQWPLDFATATATVRTLRPTLAASATVRARTDGEAHVSAPVSGRLLTTPSGFPRIGAEVDRDQVLVTMAQRLGADADIASLELAVARAKLDTEQATSERERLAGLLADGAVPERRVIAATHDERRAKVSLTAAERRLSQHARIQRVATPGSGELAVRAPIAGVVVAVQVAPGMFLAEGQEMFHIVDLDRLWLEVRVPATNIGRVTSSSGAWFEVDGIDEPFQVAASSVVASGGIVDAVSRTVPLIFEIDNTGRRLRVGMFARAHVVTREPTSVVAIPTSAVIDDGGQDVVFVQREGESFARRVVALGTRDGDFVEVVAGVRTGERVVTRGAFMVKLAASATEAPAHGHAH